MIRLFPIVFLTVAAIHIATGQDHLIDKVDAQAVKSWYASTLAENLQKYGDNPDVMVRRGVIANRKTREVLVQAIATGVQHDPIEFFLVTEFGRDYEAIAVTLAKPSIIHQALEFIGVKPGNTVNAPELVFWPKGERVIMHFQWQDNGEDGPGEAHSVRAEKTILDRRTDKSLPEVGLMFTGSVTVQEENEDGVKTDRYAADLGGEVASDFNERWTVLDVPYRAEQGVNYGRLMPNPEHLFEVGQRLWVKLTPMAPPGETRIRDYRLRLSAPDGVEARTAADLLYTVTGNEKDEPLVAGSFEDFLAFLQQQIADERDPYITLALDRDLTIPPLVEFAQMIEAMGESQILRLDPDPTQLYHQAFLPDPRWYDREERVIQPLEVFIGGETQRAVLTEERYGEAGPTYTEKITEFNGPEGLKELVSKDEEWPATLFLRVPVGTTYGTLLDYYLPVREHFPILFVLSENDPAAD